jgi:hypothetical protein
MICDGAPLVVIVPADLVAARIRRKNPSLSKETARQMAAELDDITACAIACARKQLWAEPGFSPAHENELIEVMTYVIIEGDESADGDHEYLVGMLYDPDTEGSGDDLYLRYMRLFDRINGTNMVGDFDLDGPPMKKPELCIVRNDLPPFDTLKQAVIAAVLLARKGEGPDPKRILDHAAAFRDATGLKFIMNVTAAHHAALFDLVQNAGIPVKNGDLM